ncbi:MAG: NAD(P)/FAD-dependent oxidoreductase [Burkholderiales bacterium]
MTLDVAVVGAGPAGLAAATLAAERGLSVSLYDAQGTAGGQVYRAVTTSPLARADVLDGDYWAGAALVKACERSGTRYVPYATVWSLARRDDGTFRLGITAGLPGARHTIEVAARAVILATGALERPLPIPGWTLPGVLMAGGAQGLLKTAGVVPRGRTVLAGCGPLLWLLAAQYLRAGVAIDALLDTTPRGRMAQALRHAPAFLRSPYFGQGLALVRGVRRQVRVIEYVGALAVEGQERATGVRYAVDGAEQVLPADIVLLHQGVVPDVALPGAAGCALAWDDAQACFAPVVDAWGATSLPGLYVAGDGAGIAGAQAAPLRGRLAALAVLNAAGRLASEVRDDLARRLRAELAATLRGRAFLDALYRPAAAFRAPSGATIACRCEEVTADAVAAAAREGAPGPNQVKAFTRCGMGPCQGRFCSLTVTEIIAREQQRPPGDVGCLRPRFPVQPVTLGDLAAMPVHPEALAAVYREAAGRRSTH